ncbi:glycosyltransferase family 64 protein [Pseudohyphozyma bogoriensis]|nr:glycosyltransferase family 64 protein [Pseudohyphozyma bogoriensis]
MLYSVKKTQTPHPFIVLVLPSVGSKTKSQIEALGAEWKEVPQLEYPGKKLPFVPGRNRPCRYSKLHMWNETAYERLVYLDVDVAVQKNIDVLFANQAWLAGVGDIGDVFNTGVITFKPSKQIFNEMMDIYMTSPSYDSGDQGFVNWYFSHHSGLGIETLDPLFNVPAKLKGFAIGKGLISHAYVHHFTSEVKPWSFHKTYHPDWTLNYHAAMFAGWRSLDYQVSQFLRERQGDKFDVYGLPLDPTPLRTQLEAYDWPNRGRQGEVCGKYIAAKEVARKWPVVGKYSVALSVNGGERLDYVVQLIEHYWASERVDMVFVTWHNPFLEVPAALTDLVAAGRLKVLKQTSDSLNNRFNPIPDLQTEAVFIADDDIFVSTRDLDFAFEVWEAQRDLIVGFYPRVHALRSDGSYLYTMAGELHEYSSESTSPPLFSIPVSFLDLLRLKADDPFASLHAYTCVLESSVHRFVDMGMNCEDIAMNMMVSARTGAAPVCVDVTTLSDFGTKNGISLNDPAFKTRRDECVEKLVELFGKDTLRTRREMVQPYWKNRYNQRTTYFCFPVDEDKSPDPNISDAHVDRILQTASWEWETSSGCQLHEFDPTAFIVRLLQSYGGLFMVGDSLTKEHFDFLSYLLVRRGGPIQKEGTSTLVLLANHTNTSSYLQLAGVPESRLDRPLVHKVLNDRLLHGKDLERQIWTTVGVSTFHEKNPRKEESWMPEVKSLSNRFLRATEKESQGGYKWKETILLASTGAHWSPHSIGIAKKDMAKGFEQMASTILDYVVPLPGIAFYYRTASPGHLGCEMMDQPQPDIEDGVFVPEEFVGSNKEYWNTFPSFNAIWKEMHDDEPSTFSWQRLWLTGSACCFYQIDTWRQANQRPDLHLNPPIEPKSPMRS